MTDVTVGQNSPGDRIKELRRRADQMATCHAWLRDYYGRIQSVLTLFSVLAGVVLVAFVLVSPADVQTTLGVSPAFFQVILALLAVANFSIVIVQLAWRFDATSSRHELAVEHYSKFVGAAALVLARAAPAEEADLQRLQEQYYDDAGLPRIPERRFLELKQWHLQKVRLSKLLDETPFVKLGRQKRALTENSPPRDVRDRPK